MSELPVKPELPLEIPPIPPGPSAYSLMILAGLNVRARAGIGIYEGTVPAHVKQQRRKRGAVAKQSRKVNRNG